MIPGSLDDGEGWQFWHWISPHHPAARLLRKRAAAFNKIQHQ
jgi:hypothetical protein